MLPGPGRRTGLWALVVAAALVVGFPLGCGGDEAEKRAVRRAAEVYFEAERRGDLEGVYQALAPSSDFRRTYSLENYKSLVGRGGQQVKDYEIIRVGSPSDEVDREAHPAVEMIAEVYVLIRYFDPASGQTLEKNTTMTFVKENGRWYKG